MQAMAEINYGIEEVNAFWEMAGEFDQGPLIQGIGIHGDQWLLDAIPGGRRMPRV